MGSPITSRLDSNLIKTVQRRAARTRRSRSDTIAELIRIGLDVLRFPGVTFVDGPAGTRAHIAGTGLDVWEVVAIHRAHGRDESAVLQHLPHLSRRQLLTALAYYADHKGEIHAILKDQARAAEEWHREVAITRPAGA